MTAIPQTNPQRRWHNEVPLWIWASAALRPRRGSGVSEATAKHVIQIMASRGNRDRTGNIINIVGGGDLALACGFRNRRKPQLACIRTLWRYIKHFEAHGVVVALSRGGVIGRRSDCGDDRKPFNAANIFGIPAHERALDHLRVRRREQCMKPTGKTNAKGRRIYVPDVTAPGSQATLRPQQRQPAPAEAGYAQPGKIGISPQVDKISPQTVHFPRDSVSLPPCHQVTTPVTPCHTTIDHRSSLVDHGHGGERAGASYGARRRRAAKKNAAGGPCIGHIEADALLSDFDALQELFRFERKRGSLGPGRGLPGIDWPDFVAFALRARAVVKREDGVPRKLFASMVNQRLMLNIEPQRDQARKICEVREEARKTRDIIEAVKTIAARQDADPFHVARMMRPGLTRAKWDEMIAPNNARFA